MDETQTDFQPVGQTPDYDAVLNEVAALLEAARRAAARSINAVMTATYWQIGRRLVEVEQEEQNKAEYGERMVERLSQGSTARFGRSFGRRNLFQMRAFYLAYAQKVQTVPAQLNPPSMVFPLPWSHYVHRRSSPTRRAADGRGVSSIARSAASSTSGPPFPATRPPC